MLRINSVSKFYDTHSGPRKVLDHISLTIAPNERIGILGSNGSGKSTLIKIISGSERPSSGTVQRGMSVSWPLAFTGGFQGSLTGADNLRFICRVYNVDYKRALPYVIDFSELGAYMNEPVKTYSSGMSARLAFAISMAVDFDCILIDEVTSVGDLRFRHKCDQELFQKRNHKAMVLVSHHESTIRKICDTVKVLSNGKLLDFESANNAFEYYSIMMRKVSATRENA